MATQKQKDARGRNWEILKLRGMYHALRLLRARWSVKSEANDSFSVALHANNSFSVALRAVDNVITLMGAESEALRIIKNTGARQ